MALPPALEDAMRDAIRAYWHDDRITAEATIQRLVAAVRLRQNGKSLADGR